MFLVVEHEAARRRTIYGSYCCGKTDPSVAHTRPYASCSVKSGGQPLSTAIATRLTAETRTSKAVNRSAPSPSACLFFARLRKQRDSANRIPLDSHHLDCIAVHVRCAKARRSYCNPFHGLPKCLFPGKRSFRSVSPACSPLRTAANQLTLPISNGIQVF